MKYAIACVFTILAVVFHVGKVHAGAGWEYEGDLGPNEWHTKFQHCGGRMQSPVNVETSTVLHNRDLKTFDFSEYSTTDGVTMTLENVDGHTVEVVYGGSPISIKGGSLPDKYVLDQFHFHWGADNSRGSEHKLNNRAAPMEMHIVHHMNGFNRSSSASQPYGLAVLGFFFTIGEHNAGFDALLSNFPDVVHKDAKKSITPFALSDLLDIGNFSGHYYRYYGSLTTPPCYETVIWTLFKDKITISQQQLDTYRTLRNQREGEPTETPISNVFRPTQPLNERSVTSNDPSLLQEAASYRITQLQEDLRQLKQSCNGASSPGPVNGAGSSLARVMRAAMAVFVFVVVGFV